MDNDVPILVTGGAGYIGSHVCKALSAAGYLPIAYDNLSNGHKEAVKWGPLEVGDINDQDNLKATIDQYHPKAVIHMAAYIAAGESVEKPGKYYRNNTAGALSLLESMLHCGVDKIVFSGTAAVYGTPETNPIKEKSSKQPINPYGQSKLMVEHMLRDFDHAHDLKYATLRYFNAAGADPEGEIGSLQSEPTNLIPILMNVQSGKQDKVYVFGTDYDTEDGTCIRDYIHVTDLAKAHVLALEYLFTNHESLEVNLGTGKGHSVNEVIESVARVSGKEVPFENIDRRPGDPPSLVADVQKAKDLLNWEAEYKKLDDITSTAWKWHTRG